ncbi:hypothetical protein P43SY_011696 [Pythium insidiosum]|uniref:Uncharacterized protein n=1 Tax=Pythium insidiosum TaxID=114742 RepID=A0AAD5L6K9_PYTIN|nr:hypothetical protein P43SY_011696 [Pythium insidiosum]
MVLTRKRARLSWKRGSGSHGEGLYQALHSGALTFLEVSDMANVLNACRALRFDEELGTIAVRATTAALHLGRRCLSDWTDPRPVFLQSEQALMQTECGEHCLEPAPRAELAELLDHRLGQHVGLLSALAMMQSRVLPLCYQDWEVNIYGDICTARPVLRLMNSRDSANSLDQATRAALNEWSSGLGDDFLSAPADYTHVSDFGAHWETIQRGTGRRSAQVQCGLCAGVNAAVKEYRREASALLKRFQDVLRDRKEEWRAEGLDAAEIHQRRSELKAEMFPDECYPDPNFADGLDDEILADICESGRFPLDPFDGMQSGFERFNDDVRSSER